MPQRADTRDQLFLLPPSLDDYVGKGDPVRFVAEFVDALGPEVWQALGVTLDPPAMGAPRYGPKALLRIWLSGFMLGIRSARGLERGCRQRFDLCWAACGHPPDFTTLWRFYDTYRPNLRALLKQTVTTAVQIGLVELAVQAVDGTKLLASANPDATLSPAQLAELEEQLERAIADLEAQHQRDDPAPPQLPAELQDAKELRRRIVAARARQDEDRPPVINRTDPQARWMKTRQGIQPGYNAQLVVTEAHIPAKDGECARSGRIILAARVVPQANDVGQLAPMAQDARVGDAPIPVTLADAGYSSAASLLAADAAGITVVAPVQRQRQQQAPYAKEQFRYDPLTDSYRCPQDQVLSRQGRTIANGVAAVRYQAEAAACAGCPVRPECTSSRTAGRQVKITTHDQRIGQQLAWMNTEPARTASARRKGLIEGVFGTLKDQLHARRTLVRGRAKVDAEWVLTATAFNLRTLARAWAAQLPAD